MTAASTLYEQDLLGFEDISEPELEAFHREQLLTAFANALRNEIGEECSVPLWARAHYSEYCDANEEKQGRPKTSKL
jgi:hypothetical protein